MCRKVKQLVLCALVTTSLSPAAMADFQPEAIGVIEQLPAQYPDHWVLIHDFSFFHMFEGEVLVVDPLAKDIGSQYKGMMPASFIAAFQRSTQRGEQYVMETFYSRGSRGGERTDVVTIYDPASLTVVDEVVIPPKRISGMPKTSATSLLANDRFLGIYNFTPGQSVSIVDLEKRTFVTEVSTAGCGFVIPNGDSSFSSICANGSFLTTNLDDNGEVSSSTKSEVVFDPNNDPVFEGPAISQGTAYFPTFRGQVLPVDVSGKRLKFGDFWWLTGDDERNWRPGGMNVITTDSAGVGYVLMNPNGGEGTHKDGGAEVWMFDLQAQRRTSRINLTNWGLSLGTSGTGDNRLLFVTNAEMTVDVYKVPSGDFVHTLNVGAVTPFLVHGAQ